MSNIPDEDIKLLTQKNDIKSDRLNNSNASRECLWETGEHHSKPYFKSGVLDGFCDQSEEADEI